MRENQEKYRVTGSQKSGWVAAGEGEGGRVAPSGLVAVGVWACRLCETSEIFLHAKSDLKFYMGTGTGDWHSKSVNSVNSVSVNFLNIFSSDNDTLFKGLHASRQNVSTIVGQLLEGITCWSTCPRHPVLYAYG